MDRTTKLDTLLIQGKKGIIANNTVDAPLDCYWMVGDAIESIICKEIQISKFTFQSLTFRIKKPRKSLKKNCFKTRCLIVRTMIASVMKGVCKKDKIEKSKNKSTSA